MAFKMKGFPFAGKSPNKIYDKPKGERTVYKQKEEKKGASTLDFDETKAPMNQKEVDMNTVYKRLDDSGWLKDTEGYSAKELAAMSDERRAGIINDYEPGSFDRMVAKIKKELKNN